MEVNVEESTLDQAIEEMQAHIRSQVAAGFAGPEEIVQGAVDYLCDQL